MNPKKQRTRPRTPSRAAARQGEYALMLETASEGVCAFDSDGRIRFCNPRMAEMLGYRLDELAGQHYSKFILPEDLPDQEQKIARRRLGQQDHYERRLVRKDGALIWTMVSSPPLLSPASDFNGSFGMFTDITERKQFENALHESEARYQAYIDVAPVGIFVSDETGHFVEVNPAACQMAGLSRRELLAMSFRRLLGPERRQAELEDLPQLKEQRPTSGEFIFTPRSGKRRWWQVASVQLSPTRWMAIASDITERKNDEETILRFKTMFDLAGFGAAIVSLEGYITYINAFLAEIHGYERSELLGKHHSIFYGPEQQAEMRASFAGLVARGRINGFEILHRRRDGVEFPMSMNGLVLRDEFGAPAFIAVTAVDLTEQKRAEQKTLETQHNLLEAQRVARLGSFLLFWDTKRSNWSEEMYRLIGRDPALDPPFPPEFHQMVHPDDLHIILEAEVDIVRNKQRQVYEYRIYPPDGRLHYFISRVEPVLDENGELLAAMGTIQDISELKEAENRVRELNEELEQRVAERTAQLAAANQELEAFSYSVSHDLRAPLRSIDGWSQALMEDYGPQLDPQAQGYLQRVRAEARRMSSLIEDLLKLSRLARAEMSKEAVDLSLMAQAIANRLLESEPERQATFEIQPGLRAYGDPRLLEVALTNLLGNAFKFTGKTPQARIEFGRSDHLPPAGLPAGQAKRKTGSLAPVQSESPDSYPAPDYCSAFFVHDNGAGFDMNYAGKLFGAFQRMHKETEFPGAGVGLAIVQRIIHRHGGRVWAEASPDQGATFYFTLEAAP